MELDKKTILGGLALLFVGWHMGKRAAAAKALSAAGAVVPSQAQTAQQSQADWWTFAGGW